MRFLANVENPTSVDFSTRRSSRELSQGMKVLFLRKFNLVVASVNLTPPCH